jgi:DNA polymerase-3 subunit epsilon
MSGSALRDLRVLALDCQAGGATPAYGDLLELGWAVSNIGGIVGPVRSHWIVPRTGRKVPRPIRELTGWSEACLAEAIDEAVAWRALHDDIAEAGALQHDGRVPTVIHYARFELPFLHDLHGRAGANAPFPFDAVCVHAIAARLFPDLPRRNIRALAGYLGHSPDLLRRSAGHVEATAFIWGALVPLLEEKGVSTWAELESWLDEPAPQPRRTRRVFPLDAAVRRGLPDTSGVYRFLRRNRDVLYVGKATSLKKRVAGHFKSTGPTTERGLELLSQVHDIQYTATASLLEAALLESDEIKRLDPPYNVQLRSGDRSAWFASRDFREAVSSPDAEHPVGPLPSERALSALCALIALAEGAEASQRLRATALAVPAAFGPEERLFAEGWAGFARECLTVAGPTAPRRIARASRELWLARGLSEPEATTDEKAPDLWDLARVRRRLERSLIQTGLLVRRARFLCLLADAQVAFQERDMPAARTLVISGARIVECLPLEEVGSMVTLPGTRPRPLRERQRSFDAAAYDRLRVLSTELRRIEDEGGKIAIRIGRHAFAEARLAKLIQGI